MSVIQNNASAFSSSYFPNQSASLTSPWSTVRPEKNLQQNNPQDMLTLTYLIDAISIEPDLTGDAFNPQRHHPHHPKRSQALQRFNIGDDLNNLIATGLKVEQNPFEQNTGNSKLFKKLKYKPFLADPNQPSSIRQIIAVSQDGENVLTKKIKNDFTIESTDNIDGSLHHLI